MNFTQVPLGDHLGPPQFQLLRPMACGPLSLPGPPGGFVGVSGAVADGENDALAPAVARLCDDLAMSDADSS